MGFSTSANISLRFANNAKITPLHVDGRIPLHINSYQGGDNSSYMIQSVTIDVSHDNLDIMRKIAMEILSAVDTIAQRGAVVEGGEG